MTTFSAIIPLIGGFPYGTEKTLGVKPTQILSYTGFQTNDSYYVRNNPDTQYLVDDFSGVKKVDVVVSTCPCAGISSASTASRPDSATNDWIYKSTDDVLNFIEPSLMIGESSNLLLADRFTPIRNKLSDIATKYGYEVSYFRTSTKFHGIPQDRKRSFYVIHRGESAGVINLTKELTPTTETVEEYLERSPFTPTQVAYEFRSDERLLYEFIRDRNLITDGSVTLQQHVYRHNLYDEVLPLLEGTKLGQVLTKGKLKFESGSRPFDTTPVVWNKRVSAMMFRNVSGYIHQLDRPITVEDVAWLMGFTEYSQFNGVTPKTVNHLCQNVPVNTAASIVKLSMERFM